MTTTPADLFNQSLTIDLDGDVQRVNVPLARRAIELHLAMGGDVRGLLQPYQWYYYPHCVLSLAFDSADLDRECRLHAAWAARSVLHLARPEDRPALEQTLEVVTRYAHGDATAQELRDARAAAKNIARNTALTALKAGAVRGSVVGSVVPEAVVPGAAGAAAGDTAELAASVVARTVATVARIAATLSANAEDVDPHSRAAQAERLFDLVCTAFK